MASLCHITADLKNLVTVRRFVQKIGVALNGNQEAMAEVVLAVNEAVTNIIVHGYQGGPGHIEIEVGQAKDALVVYLRDQAPPFDPTRVLSPDITIPLERRPLGGMGIHMIRGLVDEMTYQATPQGGNELILIKSGVIGR